MMIVGVLFWLWNNNSLYGMLHHAMFFTILLVYFFLISIPQCTSMLHIAGIL